MPIAGTLLALLAGAAQAAPLSFDSQSQVHGQIEVAYSSPFLGDISFTIHGTADYQYSWSSQSPQVLAAASYTIAPNQPAGVDPVYDIVTSGGSYGFGYQGQAKVDGTSLHARIDSSVIDASLTPVGSTPNSSLYAYANARWTQQMLIAPTSSKPAGSYGAILVGLTLDGSFAPTTEGSAWAQIYSYASFVDSAGVSYQSNFGITASNWDADWTGESTVFKKLLFQYGTPFSLSTYLWSGTYNNGSADFYNTGKISSIEIPFEAVLESGAAQAGLGDNTSLYGVVFNSSTADAENTNWDFGNNGGGFTPNVPQVPEPSTWLMLAGGLALLAARRFKAGAAVR
jgi:hypothetical protein